MEKRKDIKIVEKQYAFTRQDKISTYIPLKTLYTHNTHLRP
jgi:hypothetical protein